jgi:CheY-like chemotaxis protein
VIGPGPRILIVDDNIANLKLVSFLLADGGYDLRAAVNAEEALVLVRSFRPRLILLDLQLPDIDALEVTRRLEADVDTSGILIVAVTAHAMKGDEEKARAVGADGYITKPLEPQQFRHAVASYLAG